MHSGVWLGDFQKQILARVFFFFFFLYKVDSKKSGTQEYFKISEGFLRISHYCCSQVSSRPFNSELSYGALMLRDITIH